MAKKKTPADGDLQAQSEELKSCQGHNSTEEEKQQEIKAKNAPRLSFKQVLGNAKLANEKAKKKAKTLEKKSSDK